MALQIVGEVRGACSRVVRRYSHTERANALALYDSVGSLEQVSKTLGIPQSTIHGWINDPTNYSILRSQKAQDLAQKFENAANLFIDLAVKKSKKAQFQHLVTGAGIAVDKCQLLRGEPTSIPGLSEEDRRLRLAELMERVQARAIDVTPKSGSEQTSG
jgi:transposase-like protein